MTMSKQEPVTITVCVDCLMLLANGEVFDGHGNNITDAHAARVDAIWGDTELTLGSTDEDDTEPWFSWSACEGCGSTLGGDREYATAWSEVDA